MGILFRYNDHKLVRRSLAVVFAVLAMVHHAPILAQPPIRLATLLKAPDNLDITGNYRVRYEVLDGRFRAGLTGSDQILVERFLLGARYQAHNFYLGAELQDSRQQLADSGTPIGTDDVNNIELLRAYLGYQDHDVLGEGDLLDIAIGRLTIDMGSRRLVARNGFRNTINGFTGVHGRWTGHDGRTVEAFYTVPVTRRPDEPARLLENVVVIDEESVSTRFWAMRYYQPSLFTDVGGEVYIFGLQEEDRDGVQTLDRSIFSPGIRLLKTKKPGTIDYEFETVFQFGQSSLSSSPTAPRLDHVAHFHHAHIGYTFESPWKTRLVLQYDFASGDRDPNDGRNGRFDTLFGARRAGFGPTGIYGLLARSNINTPGLRMEVQPGKKWQGFMGYRAAFLAASKDTLTTAGVQDPTGDSGSFIGHQAEIRIWYDLLPGNIRLEGGIAYLAKGRFLETAPNAPSDGDSIYAYQQLIFTF